MDLSTFIQERRPRWRKLEAVLARVEGSGLGTLDDEQAVEFGQLYRRTASDLNQAQTFVSGDAVVQYLNDLVARSYLVIYTRTRIDVRGFLLYLFWGYPAVFRRCLSYFLLATAIFLAGTAFGFLASYFEPPARAFLLPTDMPTIQPPEEGEDADAPVLPSGRLAEFSSHLFTNNLQVSLVAFALGITLGIGTAWILFLNGVVLGALGAVFIEAHQLVAFATGVLPHGVLEIPAAILGGAAGFVLARGMIQARPWPRLEELARAGKQALWLVAGCIPLLAAAALLEAGVARAPDWFIGSGLKLAVAGIFGVIFVAYMVLAGRGKRGEHYVGRAS
ncbi:MAG TPA: stage II sporulation protein M [Gemmataceae bacterium]|jgi:uncharacterized membrane protein SpoIIM required for sporulation|nr:stage II sporulation protein M [Gemmataceae bacterium]